MPQALTGSKCPLGSFTILTNHDSEAVTFLERTKKIMLKGGWKLFESIPAVSVLLTNVTFFEGRTIQIGGVTYVFTVGALTSINQVKVGLTVHGSILNLINAVNGDEVSAGISYTLGTQKNPLVSAAFIGNPSTSESWNFTALKGGSSGNGLQLTIGGFVSKLYGGGYVMRGLTPEGRAVRFRMIYPGHISPGVPAISFNFISDVRPSVVGITRYLSIPAPDAPFMYQVWANTCTVGISVPYLRFDNRFGVTGTTLIGGALEIGDTPDDGGALVDEAWFSFGDYPGAFDSPRTNIGLNPHAGETSEGCWGGAYIMGRLGNNDPAPPRIVPIGFHFPIQDENAPAIWVGQTPNAVMHLQRAMIDDAWLFWGNTNQVPATLRGRIYDARVESYPETLEIIHYDNIDDPDPDVVVKWLNWTQGYPFGGLWLRFSPEKFVPLSTESGNDSRYIKPFYGRSQTL